MDVDRRLLIGGAAGFAFRSAVAAREKEATVSGRRMPRSK